MKIVQKSIFILSMLAVVFILFPSINAHAIERCSANRFVIEDEVSGEEIGLIFSDTDIGGDEICIEGEFQGTRYQYLYTCGKSGRFNFVKKFKTIQNGCKWGFIH